MSLNLDGYKRLNMKRIIALFIVFFTFFSCAYSWNTPDLGDPSIRALSPSTDKKYGKEFMAQLKRQNAIYNDLIVQKYIEDLGLKLASHSKDPSRHFNFFVVRDSTVNAFAGPGGNIGINTGLITYTKNQDELASVLAHEIAHVTQRHLARSIESAERMEIPSIAAVLAAVLTGNGAVASSVISATVAGNMQAYINHTREQEKEADRIGIESLIKSGYNPEGMATLFERMQKDNDTVLKIDLTFLQTHPSYVTRVADAKNRSNKANQFSRHDSMTFALVQTRIRNARISNPALASSQYEMLLAKNNSPITQYAYALALSDNKEYAKASDQMQSLINTHPNNLIFKLTLGEINLEGRNYQAGIDALRTSTMIYPYNYSLVLLYGNLLNKDKQHKAAADYLKPHYARLKEDTQFLFLYADALGKSGQLVEAYQARSRAFSGLGKTKEAITQLELALKQGTPTAYTQTSIQAQLDALQKTLDEGKKRRR